MLARKARMSRQRTDRNKGLHGVRSGERTMAMAHPSQAASAGKDISVRPITFDDLRIALRQGWDDFLAKRGDLMFIGFIYPIIVALRSEERRVGKECVRLCRSRGWRKP